jgi:pimeloyl-ACP methyl ester carboxylesterase
MKPHRWIAGSALLAVLAGCSDSEVAGHSNDVSAAASSGWKPCALIDGQTESKPSAECAQVTTPLRWSDPTGPTIKAFVKRYKRENATGQIWLTMGEPGNAATDFEPFAKRFAERGNADVYMLDHRGVGRSEPRLSCPDQERAESDLGPIISASEMPACAEHVRSSYGDSISAYTVTEAARDLGELSRMFREPNKKLFIYGVSYGTYLVQRYLQLFPSDADGVFLDSLLAQHEPTEGHMPSGHSMSADEVGRALFDACGKDPLCSSKLGTNPNQRATELYDKLAAGYCHEVASFGVTVPLLKSVLGFFSGQTAFRGAAPSLVHRLLRCEPRDVAALEYFMKNWYQGPLATLDFSTYSQIVSANIERSEMWKEPAPTLEEHLKLLSSYSFTEYPPDELVAAWEVYPFLYPHDEYYGQLAVTDTPVLAINGLMDAKIASHLGERYGKTLTKPYQHWVLMPNAGHIVLSQSPLVDDPSNTCGWVLAEQFFRDPKAELDLSCLQKVQGISFASSSTLSYTLFNTADLYE